MRSYLLNMLRGDASGQLLSYSPMSAEVVSLKHNIAYANGVAVSADGTFVALVETNTCRVLRYWLAGPHAGSVDVLIDRLPGMPDGITRSGKGGFWISLVVPLSPLLRMLAPRPWLRQLASHLVHLFKFVAKRWGCVVRVSESGEILENLMDPTGEHLSTISAVTEGPDGRLFFGNLGGDFVSVLKID
eukprot:TRINITY_DN50639_c0_g1_i1.p1 TRINITY_DN50639_c0_g1~~TRINITY_DN50639_c0_g1_i1.p1  ORF type:complete len:188 (-),score=22.46 TRINITY_DN50639_c0_g1_i1:56-619(-)